MRVDEVARLFPDTRYEVRTTASGQELVLEDCPLDLHQMGAKHPKWKTYVSPDKEVLKCFVCHQPGQGTKLSAVRRYMRRPRALANRTLRSMRSGLQELPVLPPTIAALDSPEARAYLDERRVPPAVTRAAGLLWKPEGVPAWRKDVNGQEVPVGTYPALVIPILVREVLRGWQLCAVPRLANRPKYVTAPCSALAGTLYNFDNVLKASSKSLVIMEGVFDALRLPGMAVALLTDRLTDRKRRLISTGGFVEVILCLDSDRDEAHINRELAGLQGVAPIVRAVRLMHGDPADHSPAELTDILFGGTNA